MSTALSRTPATRLFAFEALSTVLFAVPMLTVTTAGRPRVPEWAQLLGLALLLTLIGALVHTCRLTIADGLRPTTRGATGPGEDVTGRLRQQSSSERRLGWLLVLYPAALVILLPVPDTWVRFWFWSTLLLSLSGLLSLCMLLRGAGHADCRQGGLPKAAGRDRTRAGTGNGLAMRAHRRYAARERPGESRRRDTAAEHTGVRKEVRRRAGPGR
ncbi:hypothetical protein [Streptomyces sp. NPDC056154]|uniref:hypothetical protein n=1 Tax=unclassified Streptomyces TaxID=2593676 RepID=UPI0035D9D8C4